MSKVRIASDGLRARENGAWAAEKLDFLDRFVPPGLSIAKTKLSRVFVDLFAGPGMNVVPDNGREIEGSTLRALKLRGTGRDGPPFTHLHAVNLNSLDGVALSKRVESLYSARRALVPRPNLAMHHGDANELLPGILRTIHTRAYILVFADIEAPKQWPWSSVESIRQQGHKSVDLYMLFPLDMGINRLIAVANQQHTARHSQKLTQFFGTQEWRALCDRRITDSHSPQVRHGLLEIYLQRLREFWTHVYVVKDVRKRGDHRLYKMLFATNDDAAQRVADYVGDGGKGSPQLGLF